MNATAIAKMTVRVAGLIQLVLGLLTWPGTADFLIPFHKPGHRQIAGM